VGGRHRADDRQAEAGAPAGAGAVAVEAAERLEQRRHLLRRDRPAAVGHLDDGLAIGHAAADLHPAPRLVVADGVLDQVGYLDPSTSVSTVSGVDSTRSIRSQLSVMLEPCRRVTAIIRS
jgi:hypothetical protein